jgi:hypothetical protein
LQLSVSNLERGCEYWNGEPSIGPQLAAKMQAAGYCGWPGSMPAVEQRLEARRKQRATVQPELDTVFRRRHDKRGDQWIPSRKQLTGSASAPARLTTGYVSASCPVGRVRFE